MNIAKGYKKYFTRLLIMLYLYVWFAKSFIFTGIQKVKTW